ncbi:hypothetical protein RHGRI_013224 [Rhododendron griersonianum]|uniref:SRP54-type proteins GTP-binding domain-containing protein n=1 Tax=Rhododendron griersonianum TaxID=479676 RepID=A0AAV6K4V4_9ERIC|nr:hypothetical protein RHGRI_013224 [Rhododendron griersonianum]
MRQVSEATNPDLAIFVMDGSIGQAAYDQAQAFKQSVAIGAVILTKMDGHAKGGGALSAVAATKSPLTFIGTGEHMHEFEVFNVQSFVKRLMGEHLPLSIIMLCCLRYFVVYEFKFMTLYLRYADSFCSVSLEFQLGMGDLSGFIDKIQEVEYQQPEHMLKILDGNFTLRMMYDLYQSMLKGSMGQVCFSYYLALSLLPGLGAKLMRKGQEKENQAKIKRYMVMMDSMTKEGK